MWQYSLWQEAHELPVGFYGWCNGSVKATGIERVLESAKTLLWGDHRYLSFPTYMHTHTCTYTNIPAHNSGKQGNLHWAILPLPAYLPLFTLVVIFWLIKSVCMENGFVPSICNLHETLSFWCFHNLSFGNRIGHNQNKNMGWHTFMEYLFYSKHFQVYYP